MNQEAGKHVLYVHKLFDVIDEKYLKYTDLSRGGEKIYPRQQF